MGSHEGTIKHEGGVRAVGREGRKHPFPHARPCPARKALLDTLPFAIALWQIAPARPAAENPQHAVDELAIVDRRPPPIRHFAGQQVLNPLPLPGGYTVSD